jgi:hypothetical protein
MKNKVKPTVALSIIIVQHRDARGTHLAVVCLPHLPVLLHRRLAPLEPLERKAHSLVPQFTVAASAASRAKWIGFGMACWAP